MTKFKFRWHPSPSAQLELHTPVKEEGFYQVKYMPPFRTTIRTPVQDSDLVQGDFANVDADLARLITSQDARAGGGGVPAAPGGAIATQIREFGQILYSLTVPKFVQTDLERAGRFLELGMSESLLGYPWELMHDGQDFLCLKHYIGRFVNAAVATQTSQEPGWDENEPMDLKVLIIAPFKPLKRGDAEYEVLPEAEAEATAIGTYLAGLGVQVNVLLGPRATRAETFNALRNDKYQIIHFCGHAQFNKKKPRMSSLVLHDSDLTTAGVVSFIPHSKPILCFINACDSAQVGVNTSDRLDFYSLAQAILQTGAYLLGSRWKVSDKSASAFGQTFYKSLLEDGNPIGWAIRDARLACSKIDPESLAWASYVLYGDPRVCFSQK